jgi:radical SAM superfamily enzyme YgiQ (UPF0313 family)
MGSPITILLADLLHPGNQNKTFPYAAGCVGAYALEALGSDLSVEVFRASEDLGGVFSARPPMLLGFTNYAWNLELGYEVIRQAKKAAPRTVVVMGGPNYPTDVDGQRAFLERHPLVDFYVYKEGEVPFLQLLENLREVGFEAAELKHRRPAMPAVHYLAGNDFVAPAPLPRQRDLDEFPSPYLTGLLDKFFARRDLVPLIQTKRGCPFQCTFCVEGDDYYQKLASVTTDRFRAELEYIASRMAGGPPALHIADSNFGMYAHDLEICDVIAKVRDRHGWPLTIEVSTGKNKKERVLEAVRRSRGAIRFGPALQTTDPQTLLNIKRANISESVLMEMAGAAANTEQRSYTELILGLPGETPASHLRSIRAAMDAGLQRIKMYPLLLLPGTEMAWAEARREFGLRTRFRILPQSHGTYRFIAAPFPSVEVTEVVIATNTMSFEEYLVCRRFGLSVEIFYNDVYLEEIHGLIRALGLSMFDFVERCHRQFDHFPGELKGLYVALDQGVCDNLWDSRDACLEHFRSPEHLEAYAREEHKTSLGTLKAIALIDLIGSILNVAGTALRDCLAAAELQRPALRDYVDDLLEYSRLRRQSVLDSELQPTGTFRFAFDRIMERRFRVDPSEFQLEKPRAMRFWHDAEQARDIRALCSEVSNPALRARSFIYPRTDPGVNPYLRRSRFC